MAPRSTKVTACVLPGQQASASVAQALCAEDCLPNPTASSDGVSPKNFPANSNPGISEGLPSGGESGSVRRPARQLFGPRSSQHDLAADPGELALTAGANLQTGSGSRSVTSRAAMMAQTAEGDPAGVAEEGEVEDLISDTPATGGTEISDGACAHRSTLTALVNAKLAEGKMGTTKIEIREYVEGCAGVENRTVLPCPGSTPGLTALANVPETAARSTEPISVPEPSEPTPGTYSKPSTAKMNPGDSGTQGKDNPTSWLASPSTLPKESSPTGLIGRTTPSLADTPSSSPTGLSGRTTPSVTDTPSPDPVMTKTVLETERSPRPLGEGSTRWADSRFIADGTGDAKPGIRMQSIADLKEIAAPAEQKLPGGPGTSMPALPVEAAGGSAIRRNHFHGAEPEEADTRVDGVTAKMTTPATVMTAMSETKLQAPEKGQSSIDFLGQLIADKAVEVKQGSASSLVVHVKPDGQHEMSMHLRMREGRVEVQVQCAEELVDQLRPAWSQMQQSLAAQGIQVSAINDGGIRSHDLGQSLSFSSAGGWGDQANSKQSSQQEGAAESEVVAPRRSGNAPAETGRSVPRRVGRWEMWA